MLTWMHAHAALLLTGLGVLGVVTFVFSLIALPIVVSKLPADYFVREHRRVLPWFSDRPVRNTILVVGRNILGVALVLGGVVMLSRIISHLTSTEWCV